MNRALIAHIVAVVEHLFVLLEWTRSVGSLSQINWGEAASPFPLSIVTRHYGIVRLGGNAWPDFAMTAPTEGTASSGGAVGIEINSFLIRDLKRKSQKHFGISGKSSRSKWRKWIIKKGVESVLLGKAFENHQTTSFDNIESNWIEFIFLFHQPIQSPNFIYYPLY